MIAPENLPLMDIGTERKTRGLGAVEVSIDGRRAPLPLTGVDIRARVADRVAEVVMTETFHNPYREPLEAVYIFPLPGGCAVSGFEMRVGGRRIQGAIAERTEARRDYEKALAEGKRAALLEQERDDVFTVQVGNLPPGEEITVTLTCSEQLSFIEKGFTELRLPLVVAPRYIPGTPLDGSSAGDGVEPDTDRVPDASRITPLRLWTASTPAWLSSFRSNCSTERSPTWPARSTPRERRWDRTACRSAWPIRPS